MDIYIFVSTHKCTHNSVYLIMHACTLNTLCLDYSIDITANSHIYVHVFISLIISFSSFRFGSPPEWVVYHDVTYTSGAFIREVTRIDPRWLLELAPHFFSVSSSRY